MRSVVELVIPGDGPKDTYARRRLTWREKGNQGNEKPEAMWRGGGG